MGLPEEQTTPALAHDVDRTETSSQAKSEEMRTVEEKEMAQAQSEKSTMGGNVEYTTEAERLLAIRESKYLSGSESLFFHFRSRPRGAGAMGCEECEDGIVVLDGVEKP